MEIWKDIVGYEGLYQVSNLARVRSLDRVVYKKNGIALFTKGKERKPNKSKKLRYALVTLCDKNRVSKNHPLHRLVAQAFVPNPHKKPYVNHIDANKQNNLPSNLEWVTHKENMAHASKLKLIKGYSPSLIKYNNSEAKNLWVPVIATIDGIEYRFENTKYAAIQLGVPNTCVYNRISGKVTTPYKRRIIFRKA